jgi:hypothetical protein
MLVDLEIRHRGGVFRTLSAEADPRSPDDLYQLLAGAIRRAGRDESEIGDYEMDVRIGDKLLRPLSRLVRVESLPIPER